MLDQNSNPALPGRATNFIMTPSGALSRAEIPPQGAGDDAIGEKTTKEAKHHPADTRREGGKKEGGGQMFRENQIERASPDLRWTDPLVQEIVHLHRHRRRMLKAKNAIILQGKAYGRMIMDGDKEAGSALFDRILKAVLKGADVAAKDAPIEATLRPFAESILPYEEPLSRTEKHLTKLAQRLPIAPWVEGVYGLGFLSVATIVGEAGDLSAYPSVAGVWKRLGLAVIDGDGRQRRVASAEGALLHGYSPERRATVWVMADSMSKLQRTRVDKETGEVKKEPGPYGIILEHEKAKALEKGLSKSHAENRAKRHMSKAVLRDMTIEWRRAVGMNIELAGE